MEPPNNGQVGDEHFVNCSEAVYGQYIGYIGRGGGGEHCREVVHSSERPLSEVPLYIFIRMRL